MKKLIMFHLQPDMDSIRNERPLERRDKLGGFVLERLTKYNPVEMLEMIF